MSSSMSWLAIFKVAGPLVMIGGALGGIATMDRMFQDNPGMRERLIEVEQAYHRSLAEGLKADFEQDSTKSLILRQLMGLDPEMRARIVSLIDRLSPENRAFVAKLLTLLELPPTQLMMFSKLLDRILQQPEPDRVIAQFRPIVEALKLGKVTAEQLERLQAALVEQVAPNGTPLATTLPTAEGDGKLNEEALEIIRELLTTEPDAVLALLDVMADMPPQVAQRVSLVLAMLAQSNKDKFFEIMNALSQAQIAPVINNLARLESQPVGILVDRFGKVGTSTIIKASQILGLIPAATVNSLIKVTEPLSDRAFFMAVDIISRLDNKTINDLVNIGERAGARTFERTVVAVDRLAPQYQEKAIRILVDVATSKIDKFLNMAEELNDSNTLNGAIDILTNLKAVPTQEKALDIWDNLKRPANIETSIDILRNLSTKGVRQSVDLVHQLDVKRQVASFDIMSRIVAKDGFSKNARIEDSVERFTEIRNILVVEDAIDTVEKLDDKGLNQAFSVMLDVDVKRTAKAVDTFKRLNLNERANAVDTMDDIRVTHLKAAIDIVSSSDDQLLKDSVNLTKNLKTYLSRDDALQTTERAINVAASQDDKTRKEGLLALRKEKEVTAKRVLKQVDGQRDIFTDKLVSGVSGTYHTLEADNQNKFANTLSSSEGLTFGAKAGTGASRAVTQQRKLFRVDQYYKEKDEDQAKFNSRINFVAQRLVVVSHTKEDTYEVKTPSAVAGVRGKPVFLPVEPD